MVHHISKVTEGRWAVAFFSFNSYYYTDDPDVHKQLREARKWWQEVSFFHNSDHEITSIVELHPPPPLWTRLYYSHLAWRRRRYERKRRRQYERQARRV
jgi:hypothetical protein